MNKAGSSLPALHLQSRPALRHDDRLQPLAEATTQGPAPEEALQDLGANSAERDGTAAGSRLVIPGAKHL